jgi:Na+/H+-dicarboxylate symporter
MSTNEILPIVIFSIFFGVALTSIGERGKPIVQGVEALVGVMLQVTNYVMRFAPFAVFTAVASAIAEKGPEILFTFGKFVGSFYLGLAILWAMLIGAAFVGCGTWSVTSATRSSSHSRPLRPRPPTHAPWRRWNASACRRASPASSCRWAIRSISTGR